MVRFKDTRLLPPLALMPRFNSYMVRFKVSEVLNLYEKGLCFNSYMVRFKGYAQFTDFERKLVSIPIWFDLKTAWLMGDIKILPFQFLYGSI